MSGLLGIVSALPRRRQRALARGLEIPAVEHDLPARLVASGAESVIHALTTSELRNACRLLEIDSSGGRAELVERVMRMLVPEQFVSVRDGSETDDAGAYERLARVMSREELHDQIARSGLAVLSRGIPYVVQAARWRRIDAARRASREAPLSSRGSEAGHIATPFALVAADEERRQVIDALAQFPDADVLVVWRHHEGWSDEEIAAAIEVPGEPRPSTAAIRKRRERVMIKLRRALTSRNSEQ